MVGSKTSLITTSQAAPSNSQLLLQYVAEHVPPFKEYVRDLCGASEIEALFRSAFMYVADLNLLQSKYLSGSS